jgi:site-specific DNA recombinase
VYQRVSKLVGATDRKVNERARSIEEQNKANQDECDRYGWTITERYEDPGLSASRFATRDRPDYQRLVADISGRQARCSRAVGVIPW